MYGHESFFIHEDQSTNINNQLNYEPHYRFELFNY